MATPTKDFRLPLLEQINKNDCRSCGKYGWKGEGGIYDNDWLQVSVKIENRKNLEFKQVLKKNEEQTSKSTDNFKKYDQLPN